jgi:PAS domain S-box-containing protein
MVQILLVEDNPGDVRLLRELLDQGPTLPLELTHVSRLADARRHLRSGSCDVVLLDLSLPDATGLEGVVRLVEDAPTVPLVVLTGRRDERLAEEAVRAGAQEYLVKGDINARALVRVIRFVLERKQYENEQRRTDAALELLHRLAIQVGEAADVNQALSLVLKEVCETTGWATGEAWLPDAEREFLVRGPAWAQPGDGLRVFHTASDRVRFRRGEGFPGLVWASGEPLWAPDAGEHPAFCRKELARTVGLRAAMVVPVLARDDVAAVLAFFHTEAREHDERLTHLVATAAGQLGTLVERRRAEQALAASERRYRGLVQGLHDGVLICDADDRIVEATDRLCEMLGYTADQLLGRLVAELIEPGDLARVPLRGAELERTGRLVFECVLRRRDGTTFPAEIASSMLDDGFVESVVRDISERRRREVIERLLAEAGEVFAGSLDLQETLQRVGGLLVPRLADWCVIDVFDAAGELRVAQIVANDARKQTLVRRMLDRFPHETGGDAHPVARVLRTGEPQLLPQITREMLSEIAVDAEHEDLLHMLDPRSTMIVPLTTHGRILGAMTLTASESGRSYGTQELGLALELACRAALALEHARLYEQATRALQARDEVLGVVAHDLRNPLGAVMMLADSFVDPDLDREMRVRLARTLQTAAAQMDQLIQDLLDVTRVDAGRLSLARRPLAVETLLAEVRDLNAPSAERKDIRLETHTVGSPQSVFADPERVRRVLANLLENALKFTSAGGSVTLLAEARGDEVMLGVRDTGIGIAPDQMSHLFDRFWKADRKRGSGIGLGLSIAKGFVEAHGGRIWAESEPGAGSTFWFTLPADSGDGPAEDVYRDDFAVPEHLPLPYPLRLVLVDDHSIFLRSLEALLQRDGRFDVVAKVGTGEEAVERTRSLKPDVVLMDVDMPGISGIEATRRIGALGQDTRVLVLTANTEQEFLMPALEAGASGFVRKSAEFEEVVQAIEAAVCGDLAIDTPATRVLLEQYRERTSRQATSPLALLSETERELLLLAAQGYTSAEIGKRLFLSASTIDSYRSRLMRRLGLEHRSDIVRFALRHGLLKAH